MKSDDQPPTMAGFIDYVLELERLALTGTPAPAKAFAPALDGEAGRELRRLVDIDTRRDYGAFFTGSKLAERLVARAIGENSYHDPACGAADLLLAASRRLPVGKSLRTTVANWSKRLSGFDLHPEFVRAAKARLILMVRSRGVFTDTLPADYLSRIFPKITGQNALDETARPPNGTIILMNPPFYAQKAPADCAWWGYGEVNVAAVFVAEYLARVKPGTRMMAILPEVLRSGSYYSKWRTHVAERSSALTIQSWGRFDANADVDVFMLDIVKSKSKEPVKRWPTTRANPNSLGDSFDVSVGAVVPHRHKKRGMLRRFLDARSAPTGGTITRVSKCRKFKGTVVQPPFVVVKRTSRPGDKLRAAPTIVTGSRPVAVENHLIVCRPKGRTQAECRQLLAQLQSPHVTDFLNREMRCRHLTVGVVRRIPWQTD
ncbi:MAG: SAM-dependent DNA methyltransferase [Opitutae bacterium]|nr:SAM-dependent DNA methyltransferase [Opitutae bacterium]